MQWVHTVGITIGLLITGKTVVQTQCEHLIIASNSPQIFHFLCMLQSLHETGQDIHPALSPPGGLRSSSQSWLAGSKVIEEGPWVNDIPESGPAVLYSTLICGELQPKSEVHYYCVRIQDGTNGSICNNGNTKLASYLPSIYTIYNLLGFTIWATSSRHQYKDVSFI